jgi:hypothetical protein
MRLDGLLELDLLSMSLLRIELGSKTSEILRLFALLVTLSGSTLARTLLMI